MSGAFQKVVSFALRGGAAAFALALCIHGSTKRPARSPAQPATQSAAPEEITDEDIVRGWRLVSVATNAASRYDRPAHGVRHRNWWLRGGFEDRFWLDLGDFRFPFGSNDWSRFSVSAWGEIRPVLRDRSRAIAATGCPMSAVPRRSEFWWASEPDGSRVLTWCDFALNRDTNTPVSAQIVLFPDGGFVTRSNAVERTFVRVEPFDWDGDGIPNGDDPAPRRHDGDRFGQTDAHRAWVAVRVGTNERNGLYRLRATFPSDPPRRTLLTVGTNRVIVAAAGDCDFLLEKGVRHAVSLSFVPDGVSYSWDDGGAAKAAARSPADAPSQSVEFVAEGAVGRTMFEPPGGAGAEGFILWVPTLAVYADSPKYGFPVRFWTFADLPPGCPHEVEWRSDDGSVTGTGDGIWIREPVTWGTVTATLRYPDGETVGRVTARRFVAETRLALAAPGAVVFERAHANAPGEAVPMRFSALRATAAWAVAESGTVRLACEPEGAFAAVEGGVRTPLPREWTAAKDAADSREVVLDGCAGLAEAGGAAKLTLAFEPDGGGAAVVETAEIRAYELKMEAVADWPTNKIRHVFGPLERVKMSVEPSSASVVWKIDSVSEKGPNFKYAASPVPKKTEGVVTVDGASLAFDIETIAPTRSRALEYHVAEDEDWGGECPTNGQIGVGLSFSRLQLLPDWVSFQHVKVKEGFCLPTGMRGGVRL